jgi:hypothetical protein
MRTACAAVIVALGLGPALAQESTQTACAMTAFNDYNKANLALMAQSTPLMSVEATVAQRRLQEQYCLRVARCRVGDPTANRSLALPYAAAFSSCLREEAKAQQ